MERKIEGKEETRTRVGTLAGFVVRDTLGVEGVSRSLARSLSRSIE